MVEQVQAERVQDREIGDGRLAGDGVTQRRASMGCQLRDETIGQGTQGVILSRLGVGAAAPPIVITARWTC